MDVKHSEAAATGISREDRKRFAWLYCPWISPAPPERSAVIQITATRYYWQGEAGKVSWKGTLPNLEMDDFPELRQLHGYKSIPTT